MIQGRPMSSTSPSTKLLEKDNRYALIIANSRFEDPDLGKLMAPPQDAEALARALEAPDIGGFAIKKLINHDSDVAQEIEAFFAERKRDDFVLLYFSGHGLKDENGKLYLATSNTRRKLLRSTGINSGFLAEVMNASRSRRQVLVLDCCYSGAFARGMVTKSDRDIPLNDYFQGAGRIVLTASDSMQYAFEDDKLDGSGIGSIFTRVLVQGLQTGQADRDQDGLISVDEVYEYVYEHTVAENPSQNPKKWTFDAKGSFFIARNRFHQTDEIRPTVVPKPSTGSPSDYFAVQTKIIEEHSKTFVGRVKDLEVLDLFCRENKRGYFIVQGAPGQGKTAFSCHLIKDRSYVHHLVAGTGGRSDPRLILRSLLSQLAPRGDRPTDLTSIAELNKMFEERLAEVASRSARCVLVIDAADELSSDVAGDYFLPDGDALPEGVFFIVSSRPGAGLDRLRNRAFGVPHEVYELGPLNLSEIQTIVRSVRPDISHGSIERVAEASQGNPLYLQAVKEELQSDSQYDLGMLPIHMNSFYQDSISGIRIGNTLLGEVIGLLCVARKSMSIRELSSITGVTQREVYENGIEPIRQFLFENDDAFSFYHARFHEFIAQTLIYSDEIQNFHRKIVDWLSRPENVGDKYRYSSLAYHLSQLGDSDQLIKTLDYQFLAQKTRALGYAVLEDLEFLTRLLLDKGDPSVVEYLQKIVGGLSEAFDRDIIFDTVKSSQSYRVGSTSFRSRVINPSLPSVKGLDTYAAILPKGAVSADFCEIFSTDERLIFAVGDAPSAGLNSAFVARFIGNLFHSVVTAHGDGDLGQILNILNSRIDQYPSFERVTMQCASIDPARGILRLANAGHPYPVLYQARRGKCDILLVRGMLLNDSLAPTHRRETFEQYHLEICPQDVLVLVSDGLTEGHLLKGHPYGYQFRKIVEESAGLSAKRIGERILDNWRARDRKEDSGDDVSLIVVRVEEGKTHLLRGPQ
jgi:hypothetical protein